MKNYQTAAGRAGTTGRTTPKKAKSDPQRSAHEGAVTLPDAVSVAVGELAGELEEGLLAFAVGAGLQVLGAILDAEVTALAGPKGRHDPQRSAVRHGSDDGLVTLGGRQVSITRPRVRSADGSTEVALPTYELVGSTELLGRMAMERMLAKVSTRRYGAALEPVGTAIAARSRGTSRSAVSRRFVAATETALAELLGQDLSGLDLVALMVDGVHFAGHCCVVALGIDIEGTKHPLAAVEGDTENATLVTELLVGLRERGLDMSRPVLCVLDGGKALKAAVLAVFDHPVIARCQLHKIRNVKGPRAGAPAPRRRRLAARRPGRDVHRRPTRRAAGSRPHAPLHQRSRVDDRDLPRPLEKREALGRWVHGAALVRRRPARGEEAVPAGERSPAPEGAPHRAQRPRPSRCHTPHLHSERGGGRIAQLLRAVTQIPRRPGHPLASRAMVLATRERAREAGSAIGGHPNWAGSERT